MMENRKKVKWRLDFANILCSKVYANKELMYAMAGVLLCNMYSFLLLNFVLLEL